MREPIESEHFWYFLTSVFTVFSTFCYATKVIVEGYRKRPTNSERTSSRSRSHLLTAGSQCNLLLGGDQIVYASNWRGIKLLQETRPLRTGPRLDTVCCCCGGSCTATRNTLRPEGWSIVSWTAQSAEANLFRNIKNCLKLAFLWLRNFCRRPCLSGMLHFGSPVHLHQGRTSSRPPPFFHYTFKLRSCLQFAGKRHTRYCWHR